MRMPRNAKIIRLRLLAVALISGAYAAAPAQVEQFREQQTLDPARDEWLEAAPSVPGTPEGELDEARGHLARNEPEKARRLLQRWLDQHPDHPRLAEAQFLLGDAWFEQRNYWKALQQYTAVAESAGGDLFFAANRRAMDVARAFLSGQRRIVLGILRLPAYDEGIEALDRVYGRVPGTRMGEEALKLKADHFFERGELGLAQDQYANLAREYPNGRFTQLATLRAAEAAEASFPGIRFDERPLLEATTRYQQVQSLYPDFAERENVSVRLEGIRRLRAEKDLDIARWYERTRQRGAAEYYYRQILNDWPETLAAVEARSRLRALGSDVEDEPGAAESAAARQENGR